MIKTNLDSAKISYPEYEVKLPSGGWPYRRDGGSFPETLTVLPLSWETQAILATNKTGSEKLKEITRKVIKEDSLKDFDISQMEVGDQFYILAVARGLTFGEKYSFRVSCTNPETAAGRPCGHQEKITINLPDELPVRSYQFSSLAAYESHLSVSLPVSKDIISLKFPTLASNDEVAALNRTIRKASGEGVDGEAAMINRVAAHIRTVNKGAPESLSEAASYVRRIKGRDMDALDDAIKTKDSGIIYEWRVKCDACGWEYEAFIPLQSQFFRRE